MCAKHIVKNLSTYRLNVLKTDKTPTLSRICKFALSSLTNFTLSQRERVKCPAFTLAETLITLGIIGVVAAITIPTLIQKYQEKVWTTSFLRVYSILENAYKMAQNEYGTFENWGDDFVIINKSGSFGHRQKTNGQILYNNVIKPYVKVSDTWLSGSNGCMPHNYSMLDGTKKGVGQPENWMYMTPAVALPTGECIILGAGGADFYVDINSKKGPNVLGKDTFRFSFDGTNTVRLKPGPMELRWTDNANYCDRTDNHGWNAGTSCGFWVARHHNMDYLHLPFDEIKKQWRGNGKQW